MPSQRALSHAPWSASKVTTALRCPRLFHFRYVERIREPEVMPEARIGKAVHQALELGLLGVGREEADRKAIADLRGDDEIRRYHVLAAGIPQFTQRISQFRKQRRVSRQLVEYSLAVREDLTTTQFYAGDAFYRGVLDAAYVFEDHSLALVDHKTGVRHPGSSIGDQLEGYAVLAAAWFRQARRFWLGIHWVAERAVEWSSPLSHDEVAGRITASLFDNVEAAALAVDDGPRLNIGPWCERCSYLQLCPASQDPRDEPIEYIEDDDD